ncbi:MAG: NAD(P)H-dependent oxidoreductase [Campylobacteraceae bacterium]|jgi:putative NADPH-quinone reductase|nr:NAD(P)H-dependent oxidoreductase [Campylobacteraceae bacterium]
MAKNILIINGHPNKDSLNYAISDAYAKGARENGANVEVINIGELKFNPNLAFGYQKEIEFEECLTDALAKIKEANHLVFVFPQWWGSYPAIMKGFIDRLFLPKITFGHDDHGNRVKLLRGKTARIITTMGQPVWYYRLVYCSCATVQLKRGTLRFCGIEGVKATYFGSIAKASRQRGEEILKTVEAIGLKEAN